MSSPSIHRINLNVKTSIAMPHKAFSNENLEKSINLLVYGVTILKFYRSSKLSHFCQFYILEDDPDYLQWISALKPYSKSRIDIKTIKYITDDPQIAKIGKKYSKSAKREILYISSGDNNQNKVLILKFKDENIKAIFWQGLQYLSRLALEKNNAFGDLRKKLAQKLFIKADKDGNKSLSIDEIKSILMKLHIQIKHGFLIDFFKKYDKDKNNAIDLIEFQEIIDDISLKPELKKIFLKYCKEAQNLINEDHFPNSRMYFLEFQEFMKKDQKQTISHDDFVQMILPFHNEKSDFLEEDKSCNSLPSNNMDQYLTFSEFCSYIFSRNNQLFDPDKLETYQNMDHPLTDYYINSSHNTYLLNNQLTGESSIKAYINAFYKGCRCVELDCWEGEKGEPVIYHGHTLTSKILFQDAIKTIKDYAFANNPYPVILSLENHCKNRQNERIAEILTEILGESLYLLPDNYLELDRYPSPNSLKYKFLVKDKCRLPILSKCSSNKVDLIEWENRSEFEIDDDEGYRSSKDLNLTQLMINVTTPIRLISSKSNIFNESSNKIIFEQKSILAQNRMSPTHSSPCNLSKCMLGGISKGKNSSFLESPFESMDINPKKENITPVLRKLLVFFAIKLSLNVNRSIWNISSVKEAVFEKYAKNNEDQLQDFLRNYFLRVYPSATRVNSSNFDPIQAFNFGVQMTALNFQTNDIALLLNMSKFLENGGVSCGYVLKPEFLRKEKPKYLKSFHKIHKILYLEIISGQQLRPENEEDVRDVVDPYVEVSLRGASIDEIENSKVFRSIVVQNNGFNPLFRLNCQFKLSCPELAFIIFKVFDQEITMTDRAIGWNAIPFGCMRAGFRLLPLLNSNLDEIEFAGLLCHVDFKEVVGEFGREDSNWL